MKIIVDKIKSLSHNRQSALTVMRDAKNDEAARELATVARCLGEQMHVLQDLLRDLCLNCEHHECDGDKRRCRHPHLSNGVRGLDGDGASEWCPR